MAVMIHIICISLPAFVSSLAQHMVLLCLHCIEYQTVRRVVLYRRCMLGDVSEPIEVSRQINKICFFFTYYCVMLY